MPKSKNTKSTKAAKADDSARKSPRRVAEFSITAHSAEKHPVGFTFGSATSGERHQRHLTELKKRFGKKPFSFSEISAVTFPSLNGGSQTLGDVAVIARLIAGGYITGTDKALTIERPTI